MCIPLQFYRDCILGNKICYIDESKRYIPANIPEACFTNLNEIPKNSFVNLFSSTNNNYYHKNYAKFKLCLDYLEQYKINIFDNIELSLKDKNANDLIMAVKQSLKKVPEDCKYLAISLEITEMHWNPEKLEYEDCFDIYSFISITLPSKIKRLETDTVKEVTSNHYVISPISDLGW